MSTVNDVLKQHNLRATHTRKNLLKLFLDSDSALSNHDIEIGMPDVDRITLYRSLKTFQEKGIIHKAFDGTEVAKYASCSSHCTEHAHHDEHLHFHCNVCDNTFCVDEIKIPEIPMPDGFKAQRTNIVIEGRCQNCS